ncbi:hypothetical protein J27TS7_22920 [Paenibacillus dendritiformis]|uniref:DUF4367 domain-containing protein n=1 Tax=Paenibacillus dendritiformis TaxID=130049 RepID=UPI001B2CF884|nr:DUF4367 domain-containing protein [Paenibacillus dendritiformis]GIO72778.1 hypothetical protein J27TS7_22920 [Paenibacillus dendritiformis]
MLAKKTVAAAMASMLLLSAVTTGTAGAATAVQSKSAKTEKKKEAAAAKPPKFKKLGDVHDWVYKHKKPEELYVLYDATDGLLTYFMGTHEAKTYKEFTQKQSKYKGPAIPEPGALPEGYRFKRGEVSKVSPMLFGQEYKEIVEQLKAEAEKQGLTYYLKKMDWDTANHSFVGYSKGKNTIGIYAQYHEEMPKGMTRMKGKGTSEEKIEIDGIQALYVTYSDTKNGGDDRLEWLSADGKVDFKIMVTKGSGIGKEQLIEIAKSLISASSSSSEK